MFDTPIAGVFMVGMWPMFGIQRGEGSSMSASKNLEARANAVVEDLAQDVQNVLSDVELASKEEVRKLKQRVDSKLTVVRALAAEKSRVAAQKAKSAAQTANVYAHDEPWQIAGAALAVGILVGLALGSRR